MKRKEWMDPFRVVRGDGEICVEAGTWCPGNLMAEPSPPSVDLIDASIADDGKRTIVYLASLSYWCRLWRAAHEEFLRIERVGRPKEYLETLAGLTVPVRMPVRPRVKRLSRRSRRKGAERSSKEKGIALVRQDDRQETVSFLPKHLLATGQSYLDASRADLVLRSPEAEATLAERWESVARLIRSGPVLWDATALQEASLEIGRLLHYVHKCISSRIMDGAGHPKDASRAVEEMMESGRHAGLYSIRKAHRLLVAAGARIGSYGTLRNLLSDMRHGKKPIEGIEGELLNLQESCGGKIDAAGVDRMCKRIRSELRDYHDGVSVAF